MHWIDSIQPTPPVVAGYYRDQAHTLVKINLVNIEQEKRSGNLHYMLSLR